MTAKEIRRNYYQLLRAPEWISFSRQIIQERGACFECGETENLQCHHKGYRDILPWEYNEDEIEVMCNPCHKQITKHADDLWNESLRHLSTWEIYEVTKAIRNRELRSISKILYGEFKA